MKILLAIEPGDIGGEKYLTFGRWAICNDKETDYGPFPFRMAYTSSLIEREVPGVELFFEDPFIDRKSSSDFIDRVVEVAPDILIVQASSILWQKTCGVIREIKQASDAFVVVCGNYPTAEAEKCLKDSPETDAVFVGEYMETARDLALSIETGSPSFADIDGLVWRKDGERESLVVNKPRALMNINDLPWPDRKRIDATKYRNFTVYHPTFQMLMSMGCPCHCIFCVERHVMYKSSAYRFRNPGDIVDEMLFLKNEMGARQIWFDDDTVTADKDAILGFCKEKSDRKLDLPFGVMGDLMFSDEEVIRELAAAGCIAYAFGVESADLSILKKIGKPLDPEKVKSGVRWLRKYGIISHGTFSFGHPGETVDTMKATFEYARALGCDNAQFSIATPYPGTPFYRQAEKEGWIAEPDISKWFGNLNAVVSYPDLSKQQIESTVAGFNEQWEKIAARKRIMLAVRYPLRGLAKLRHEGIVAAAKLAFTATGLRRPER